MSRWKASAIHLSLSVLVISAIAGVLIWRWYPPGLFHMAQADKLLLLLGGVDVVLGPLLTLIVYKQGKKSLRFDLSVVALIQVAALTFGLHTVWETRPVYLVASERYFDLVFANEIDPSDLAKAAPAYQRLPIAGARVVAVMVPKDPKKKEEAMWLGLAGKDLQVIPANYLPYSAVRPILMTHAVPVSELLATLDTHDRETLLGKMNSMAPRKQDIVAVPVHSARGTATMLLDAGNGRVLFPVAISMAEVESHPEPAATAN